MKRALLGFAYGFALVVSAMGGEIFGDPVKVEDASSRVMAVCVEGNRLYAGGGPDFYVFDISEPLKPKRLGHINGLAGVRQIAVRNGMAYVSAREAGLWIIDATDPARPRVRSRFDCCELATGVDVAGDVVFLGQRQNGVEFIDVSDPDHPAHIAMRKTDESQSVKYRNGYVYSGDWGSAKLTVFDARDMKNIRQVAYEDLWGFGDGVWLKGKYLYASTGHHARHRDLSKLPYKGVDSQELHLYGGAGPGAGCGHGLDIFDVSDPTHPRRVGRADYPPLYVRGLDMWTPRTSASSDLVFCAATHDGLFAVDCADPTNPKVVDRWTAPLASHPEWPSCCIGSVAVGNGCVYAGGMGCGLIVLPAKGAAQETFEQGPPPIHASYREPYLTDENEFRVWKPARPGQARAVAVAGDVVYAACGDAGLHVLQVKPEGGIEKIGELTGHPRVFDVQVDGTRLYTAEGLDGFGFYEMDTPTGFREIGRLPQIGPGNNLALCLWVADRNHLILSSRNGGCRLYDISDPTRPKDLFRFGTCPGWDKFLMDAPIGGGRYMAYNNAHKNILWIDLGAEPQPSLVTTTKYNFIGLENGICRFDENRALVTSGADYLFLAPNEGDPPDCSRWPRKPLPGPGSKLCGIPRKDPNGTRVVKTCRINREVALYDFADPENPVFLKRWKVSGNPDIATFWKGKVVIPCGHQGVLLQK
ncbi:MAG: hypothetical protein IJR99_11305 [Kiritimatiellae bacterium]|nr:hypothetical protein [Kiritimatiellia bacterium]